MNNGYQIPQNFSYGSSSTTVPYKNINQSYYNPYNYQNIKQGNDERLAGGFVFPFLLGGVTGAAIAPAFWNNNNRPPVYYYQPGPYYPYPPRRWF